jgi:hypothetical protein
MHKERSLSLTRRKDGLGLYCCHRGKCGRSGRVGGGVGSLAEPQSEDSGSGAGAATKIKPPRVYTGETELVSPAGLRLLSDRFGYTESDTARSGLLQDIRTGAFVVPIYGPRQDYRGVYVRSFEPRYDDIYRDTDPDGPLLGWYWSGGGPRKAGAVGVLVLVEDAFSAIKVARQFNSVCLFGTHINLDAMLEVVSYSDEIVLALDKDAFGKAMKFKQRFAYLAPHMRVVQLEKDLKYETDGGIKDRVLG